MPPSREKSYIAPCINGTPDPQARVLQKEKFMIFKILAGLIILATVGVEFAQAQETQTPAPIPIVAGCQPGDYQSVLVCATTIAPSGRTYSPKCLKVQRGTQVTIVGSAIHPVQGMGPINGVQNPFTDIRGGAVEAVTKTLSEPGVYGYFCTHHGDENGNGMAGAILVE